MRLLDSSRVTLGAPAGALPLHEPGESALGALYIRGRRRGRRAPRARLAWPGGPSEAEPRAVFGGGAVALRDGGCEEEDDVDACRGGGGGGVVVVEG